MRILLTILLAAGLLPGPASGQTCIPAVNVPDSDPTSGSGCNVIPFGQSSMWSAGYTYAGRIPAGFMDSVNTYVDDIAFTPCNGSGTWSANTVIIGLGHVPSPLPTPFNFPTFDASGVMTGMGSFLDVSLAHNSFAGGTPAPSAGPFSWTVTQDTWSPMGFSALGGTGFTWNGVDDIAFFVTFQNSTVTGWGGSFHTGNELRFYAAGYNATTCTGCNSSAALKIQLQVTQGPGLPPVIAWQCNQTSSSMDINGAADPGPLGPMTTAIGTNQTATLNLGGLSGQPWDIAVTSPEPGVSSASGGFNTAGGQAVNIDLAAPSLTFAFNLSFTNAFSPASIPLSFVSPIQISAQQIVLDPNTADGFALSHLNELSVESCNPQQNFDNLATGQGIAPVAWTNPSSGVAWTVHSGGTSSSGTGPTSASSPPNYMYCETSGSGGTANFVMDTCAIDLGLLASFTLNFNLSRIGATVGTLNIWQDDDSAGTFGTLVATYMGSDPSQAQGATEWTLQSIPFVPGGTSTVTFRFDYTGGGSFTGDLAIDDFDVQ